MNAAHVPGPVRWLIVTAPVGIWMVHLVVSAAVVQFTTTHGQWHWVLYAITPICAIPIVVCIVASWLLYSSGGDPEGGDDAAQLAFLGELGVYLGAFNLLLVLAEGAMVPALMTRG